MKKVELGLQTPEHAEIKIFGNPVSVKPYLSIQEQVKLIEMFLNAYFFTDAENRTIPRMRTDLIGAETVLILGILEFCTNIDTNELSVNLIYNTNFHLDVVKEIKNYKQFIERLNAIKTSLEKEIEVSMSVGGILDKIFSKIVTALEELDLSPDKLDSLITKISELGKAVEDSKLSGLMDKK